MKLHGVERPARDSGREGNPIIALSGEDFLIGRNRVVGVDEIHRDFGGKALVERAGSVAERIPAHVGNLEIAGSETHDATGKNAEPLDARRFLAGFEEELVAETNAEVGLAGCRPFADGFPQTGGAEVFRAVCEGADAGNDDRIETRHFGGRGDEARRGARGFEGLADASKIAAAVVDDAKKR